jgi:hypothetical protein
VLVQDVRLVFWMQGDKPRIRAAHAHDTDTDRESGAGREEVGGVGEFFT